MNDEPPRLFRGISIIRGKTGSGKSATGAWIAAIYALRGYNVYANYIINVKNFTLLKSSTDIKNARYGILILDEAWTLADSRKAMQSANIVMDSIILAARKQGLDVVIIAQDAGFVDVRLRKNAKTIITPLIKYELFNKDKNINELHIQFVAAYSDNFLGDTEFRNEPVIFKITGKELAYIFGIYDTNELVTPIDLLADTNILQNISHKKQIKTQSKDILSNT